MGRSSRRDLVDSARSSLPGVADPVAADLSATPSAIRSSSRTVCREAAWTTSSSYLPITTSNSSSKTSELTATPCRRIQDSKASCEVNKSTSQCL